jgi:hypothetical protein
MITDKIIQLHTGFAVVLHDNDHLNQMDGQILLHVDDCVNQKAYTHLDKNRTDQYRLFWT